MPAERIVDRVRAVPVTPARVRSYSRIAEAIAAASLRSATAVVAYAAQARNAVEPETRLFLSLVAREKWRQFVLLDSMARHAGASASFVTEAELAVRTDYQRPPAGARAPLREVFPLVYGAAVDEADMYCRFSLREQNPALKGLYETLADWAQDHVLSCRVAYLNSLADDFFGNDGVGSSARRELA